MGLRWAGGHLPLREELLEVERLAQHSRQGPVERLATEGRPAKQRRLHHGGVTKARNAPYAPRREAVSVRVG